MKKNSKLKKGFTLIEFLTVTVVISSIGLVIVGILTSSLRGNNKTNIVNLVRINGNGAIVQMTKTIKYAKSFDGVSLNGDPNSYTTNCVQNPVPTPTPTLAPIKYSYVKITAFDQGQVIFSCTSDNKIASNGALLIDANAVSVVPGKCWFTCTQERATSYPIIGISFQLMQSATNVFAENTASVPFETSVSFRNLVK